MYAAVRIHEPMMTATPSGIPIGVTPPMNHQLITEVARTTAATLALLASSPSRLTELKADLKGSTATVSWKPSPESGVTDYLVLYGPAGKPDAHQLRVTTPTAVLKDVAPGSTIAVKAVNSKGLEGWDWARVIIK